MCLSCNGGIRDWTTLNKEFRDNSMFIGLISGISTEMKSLSKDMTVKKKKKPEKDQCFREEMRFVSLIHFSQELG